MQTMTVDQKLTLDTMQLASLPAVRPPSLPMPTLPSLLGPNAGTEAAVRNSLREDTLSELDAMLIRDPNTGAVQGLRAAMLFNAGLALSGLIGWEVWTMMFR